MADSVDIAKARRILNGFSSFELNDLLRQDLPDLIVDHAPKQRPGARQRPTRADAVADAISALQEPQLRLQALASVHCFFLRTRADKMMPWSLFKVSTDATVTDDVLFNNRIFIESVARFLKEECSCDVELRWKLQRGAVYACFLMQDLCEVLHLHAHHAVYLVHCPGLPLLAACVSRTAMFVPLAMALDRALCTFEIKRVKVPHTTLACAFQDALRSVGVSKTHGGPEAPLFLRESAFEEDGSLKDGTAEPGVIDIKSQETADRELEAAVIFEGATRYPVDRFEVVEEGGDGARLRVTGGNVLESMRRLYMLGCLTRVGCFLEPALDSFEYVVVKRTDE
ncbi:uncharacterized protein ISCGN_025027 [Ixodes scapularis]